MMTGSLARGMQSPGWLSPGRRVYAVGDVHGHDARLAALHRRISDDLAADPAPEPLLVHLGDYIDRGPDSAGVVGRLAAGRPVAGLPTVNLRGNHEQMMLDALADPEAARHWLLNKGAVSLQSWGIDAHGPSGGWAAQLPPGVLDFLRGLGLTHRLDGYLFVHAGVRPGAALARQTADDLLWIREGFLRWSGPLLPDAPDLVAVHGHTPHPTPQVHPHRIGIDTGAYMGGPLTCAVLEGRRVRFLTA